MSLDCSLDASTSAGSVSFTFTVENAGSNPVELNFSSAQTHDVTVFHGDTEVWRLSEGQMFAQMMASETLDGGESVTYGGTWEDPSPGEYEAVAELATRGEPGGEARTTVSV